MLDGSYATYWLEIFPAGGASEPQASVTVNLTGLGECGQVALLALHTGQ